MDPIIAVHTIKLTQRSAVPIGNVPAITNEQIGEAAAEAVAELYEELGVEVEVNVTSIEQTSGD